MTSRCSRRACLLTLAGGAWPLCGTANAPLDPPAADAPRWPTRAIRILVAYPPGGVSDSIARSLAERLSRQLAVPVLVENRGGAGGALAVQTVARSEPDGHLLCFTAVTALLPPSRDARAANAPPLAPVAGVMQTPALVVGTPALQADSLAGMLALARAQPGGVRWATTGEGTTGHLMLQAIGHASDTAITHVPYKGGGQQITDALAGQFEVLSTNVAPLQLGAIRAGRLKPLAVGAPARVDSLPLVPTLAELGFPEANLVSLFGLFAPRATPGDRIERINQEVNIALRDEALRARLLASSNLPVHGSPAEFVARVLKAMAMRP